MQFSTILSIAALSMAYTALAAPNRPGDLSKRQDDVTETDCNPGTNSCEGLQDCVTDEDEWPEGTEVVGGCGPIGTNTCTGLCMAGAFGKKQ